MSLTRTVVNSTGRNQPNEGDVRGTPELVLECPRSDLERPPAGRSVLECDRCILERIPKGWSPNSPIRESHSNFLSSPRVESDQCRLLQSFRPHPSPHLCDACGRGARMRREHVTTHKSMSRDRTERTGTESACCVCVSSRGQDCQVLPRVA